MPAAYPNNNVFVTGTLATSAVTANQVILTYTVPAGKTFWWDYFEANAMLTTFAATATAFGTLSIRQNGNPLFTFNVLAGPGILTSPIYGEFTDSMPFQAGDVLTIVCTPSAVTPFTWEGNISGYTK